MYADFIYARLYMGCGYPTVDNYPDYICAISVFNSHNQQVTWYTYMFVCVICIIM